MYINKICPLHLTHPLQGAVGCHCAAPGEHSGAKGLAQGPRVVICGIQTWPLVSPLEHKPPVLTTRPPLPRRIVTKRTGIPRYLDWDGKALQYTSFYTVQGKPTNRVIIKTFICFGA
ncbi:hypothetical protein XENORESO_020551 [Xenotaenia resolanae]|uniref:Uncharacterized protein n=1 Tax=Xenotaenia resolanae TaxID=208358 RepID=A0ABV0WXP6_9TELE